MFLCATAVYAMAAPVGYRILGEVTEHPSFATLPVYIGILTCFSLVHIITLLWDPQLRQTPPRRRRIVAAWSTGYGSAAVLMIVFFLLAELHGPADPLRFNTAFADDPMVLLFLAVFLSTLTSGTLNTFRQCRRVKLEDPQLNHSLRAFALAMLGVFGYVVCNAPAIVLAALGNHTLDTVGVYGSTFGVIGTVIMCYGLSGSAVVAWVRERHDFRALQPLWDLVVAGVDQDLAYSKRAARSRRPIVNVTFHWHRRVIEISDGIRALRPWVSSAPVEAVYRLNDQRAAAGVGPWAPLATPRLEAAATAAALRDAARGLQKARRARGAHSSWGQLEPADAPVVPLPDEDTPAGQERHRLLRVAKALSHPIVVAALQECEGAPAGGAASAGVKESSQATVTAECVVDRPAGPVAQERQ
ncbi:hypothetical protein ADZ36_20390 [Streptomyces fradiae]|uniref:Uncharacterized protein n=2 Tax=Streptomyces TaxID=1883 RepID=A0ACC4W9H3_STRFR|nr:hypothetical protein ADZ36_20390 [Streptomyces fradiae]OFA50950.1 hypothetical protein BEN35_15065 [Streptomyces fradiae]